MLASHSLPLSGSGESNLLLTQVESAHSPLSFILQAFVLCPQPSSHLSVTMDGHNPEGGLGSGAQAHRAFSTSPAPSGCPLLLLILFNCSETVSAWQAVGAQEESACQYRKCQRLGFGSWVGNSPWKRKWQPTPVFLPGKIPWTEEPGNL